jgi:hypothetical protein
VADNVGRLTCVAALVGFAAAGMTARGRLTFAWLVVVTGAAAPPVLMGTPLNGRYFLTTFAVVCLFAAGGALSWTSHLGTIWKLAGIACCGALVLQVGLNLRGTSDQREILAAGAKRRDAARAVLTRGPIPCRPLVVPAARVRMLGAVWTGIPLSQVRDGHEYRARGTYLTGTEAAMRGVVTLEGRSGTAAAPPEGATVVRSSRGWELREQC